MHEIGMAAYLIADNHRPARIHDLVDDKPPGLVQGWQHENIAEIIKSRQFRLVAEAEHPDTGEAGGANPRFNGWPLFSVTHDQQVCRRLLSRARTQTQECIDKVNAALARSSFEA